VILGDDAAAERAERLLLRTVGPVIGRSRAIAIHEIVYVVPEIYCALSWRERRAVARTVGQAVHACRRRRDAAILLLGPGRWGSDTPELGVPVTIDEIDRVSVLCECFSACQALVPEPSLGCHFAGDLMAHDILYLGVHVDRSGHALDREFLAAAPSALDARVEDAARWNDVLRVVVPPAPSGFFLRADAALQRAECTLGRFREASQ
jgi:hypothetical protein